MFQRPRQTMLPPRRHGLIHDLYRRLRLVRTRTWIFVTSLSILGFIFWFVDEASGGSPFVCEEIELPSVSAKDKLCKIVVGDQPIHKSICKKHPNLSILFAPGKSVTELPAFLGTSCPSLQMMSFKSNQMTSIHPNSLQPQLRWLILTDNQLTQIPSQIGNAVGLKKLMLSGNRLTSLPTEMSRLTNLELIRLASNQLSKAPMDVLGLPNLAWVALSGNPFLPKPKANASLPILEDTSFEEGEVIGQGASGITKRSIWNGVPVAVKTYKSQIILSDGSPSQERTINEIVGSIDHPSLLKVYGQTKKDGSLVMELLEGYSALGEPPSMDSCTRDVYPPGTSFAPHEVKRITSNLLEVLVVLHSKGVAHGDFYAHNIQIRRKSSSTKSSPVSFSVKLTDFGASFVYNVDALYGVLIQKIEMRAFGHLIGELTSRINAYTPSARVLIDDLTTLQSNCFKMDNFDELFEYWDQLHQS